MNLDFTAEELTEALEGRYSAGLELPKLPRVEVVRRLRDRLQPILLFGETETEACERLRILEVEEPEPTVGSRNDYK